MIGLLFVGTIYQIKNVEATPINWYGYITDSVTHKGIADAICTIKFGLYVPPWYVWGNSDTTNSMGYYTIFDDLPEDWGATFLKVEADGYMTRTYEIPADINALGGRFDVSLRPIEK